MALQSLHDLFIEELQDLYDAENQILKALPKMAKATASPDLRQAFEQHETQTRNQVQRLEQVFRQVGETAKGKHCKGMEGLIAEGQERIGEDADPEVRDAGLIGAAQRVEHYEIAGYGTARTYARMLGHDEAARLLQETLREESATDERLTQLAESRINPKAAR